MTSTYSPNLKLTLMGTGDQSGTWGDTTNTNLGTLVEEAIAGYTTQALAGAGPTALTIPDGTTSVGRNYVIEFTGTPTAGHTVTVPAVDKPYILFNNTNIALIVKVSGQTGFTIAVGKKAIAYTNSTDLIEVANAPVTEAGTQTLTNKTLTSPTIATPTITTSATVPLVIGGTAVSSALTLQSTSGVGTSDSIAFKVGNNGATTAMTANTSGNIEFRAGTAALPALTTTGDTNTGIFFPAADTIAFTEGGAEAMRINSSGNVGIGETNPTRKLDVAGTAAASYYMMTSNTASAPTVDAAITRPANGTLALITNSSERMRITSSGNVGIGTTAPSKQLYIYAADNSLQIQSVVRNANTATGVAAIGFNVAGSGEGDYTQAGIGLTRSVANGSGSLVFYNKGSGTASDFTTTDEKMRLDASGNLVVGSTSSTFALSTFKLSVTEGTAIVPFGINNNAAGVGASNVVIFARNGTQTGAITVTGTTTAYATSSDYRLKENVQPMSGALAKVALLKPCTYQWKADGSDGEGFLAHELAEVCHHAVFGEKDATNDEGDILAQSVDASFLIATLTAAIQEQQAMITALTARITALEVTP